MSFLLGRSTSSSSGRPQGLYSSPFGQQTRSEGSVLYDADGLGDQDDELEAAFGGDDDEDGRSDLDTSRLHRGHHNGGRTSEEIMYPDDSLGQEEAAALLRDDGIANTDGSNSNRNGITSTSDGSSSRNGGGIALNHSTVTLDNPTNASVGGYDFERDPYERSSTGRPGLSATSSTTSLPLSARNARRNAGPQRNGGLLAIIRNALPARFKQYGLLNNGSSNANGRRQDGTLDHDDDEDDWDAPPPLMPGIYGGGVGNDGVFSNMTAKPGSNRRGGDGTDIVGGDDEAPEKEIPPAYEMAVLDSAPPYFDTTVHATLGGAGGIGIGGGLDEILIQGLPVGNIFSFFWSLLVSMSFQFIGFLLTTLLSTSHAAKNGSRAGLGITLIQYGLFIDSRGDASGLQMDDNTDKDEWAAFWGGDATSGSTPTATAPSRSMNTGAPSLIGDRSTSNMTGPWGDAPLLLDGSTAVSGVASSWLSMVLMIGGWFLLVASIVSYLKALRYAKALRDGGSSADSMAEQGGLLGLVTRVTGHEFRRREHVWGLPSRPAPPPVQEEDRPPSARTPTTGPSTAGISTA